METTAIAEVKQTEVKDYSDEMKVLDQYVLVKQVMKKKKTIIQMDAARDNKEKFDYSFEVVQLGNKCERDIQVGDHPIFSQHVTFSGVKVIEKTKTGMISLVIVHEGDVIAIDNKPDIVVLDDTKEKIEEKSAIIS